MRFYDRTRELRKLREMREASFDDHSRLTVVTGRRRVGKTALITKDTGDYPMVYLFVGRKNEVALCEDFCNEIASSLNIHVPKMTSFKDVFAFLLLTGSTRKFTLIIDEFQEFFNINPSVYSDMQNIWDRNRLNSNVNLIVSGSIYSLMNRIFKDSKEPLFGRADTMIRLRAFSTDVLKEILSDYNPDYSHDDLLAMYLTTGGVAKYVELLMDRRATSRDAILHAVCDLDSPFRDEGKNVLIEEFGKNYGTYFSILAAISAGKTTQREIESTLGNKSIGGQLTKLEDTYEVIKKTRPIKSKPGSQTVRYHIADQFLDFWFRYYEGNRSLVEMGLEKALEERVKGDYTTYSGTVLEKYFKQKLAESQNYKEIGSYWESKKGDEQCEIDIVAIPIENQPVMIAEVKRQKKELDYTKFIAKVDHLRDKHFAKQEIVTRCLTLEDM